MTMVFSVDIIKVLRVFWKSEVAFTLSTVLKSVISDSEQHISPYIFYFSIMRNFLWSANVTVLAPIFGHKVQKNCK